MTGMPDMWTALQFDNAVMMWGRHIDNKMKERNEDGSLANDLRMLLDIPLTSAEAKARTKASLRMLDALAANPRSGIKVVH